MAANRRIAPKSSIEQSSTNTDWRDSLLLQIQTALLMQPPESSFHDPSDLAQTAALGMASTGNDWRDSPLLQKQTVHPGVISPIGQQSLGLGQWPPLLASDRGNRFGQRQQLNDILVVRLGQLNAERNTFRIREDVEFRSFYAPAGGFGPVLAPQKPL